MIKGPKLKQWLLTHDSPASHEIKTPFAYPQNEPSDALYRMDVRSCWSCLRLVASTVRLVVELSWLYIHVEK